MTESPINERATPDWTPSPERIAAARISDFARAAADRTGLDLTGDYPRLWEWSVSEPGEFWALVWEYFGLPERPPGAVPLADPSMPGTTWFPGSRLNYTQEVFRGRSDTETALTVVDERFVPREISWAALRSRTASVAAALRELGVRPGDRVVGYLPNSAEAVVAFLATAAIGAVWAICGLDYAATAAEARFGQLEPTVLIAADEYTNAGRRIDRRADVAALRAALPSLKATILVGGEASDTLSWAAVSDQEGTPRLQPLDVPFDHPLWVLFSSGTTGLPKGIVHGHGGIVLEQLKTSALHLDLHAGDRVLWHTTPSWMMWNSMVSTLLLGTSIVCYEGSPTHPSTDTLWRLASLTGATLLGTSPGYLAACRKHHTDPAAHDLSALTRLAVTGSAFPAALHRWVAARLDPAVQIGSISGGTDACTAFAGPVPTHPVWAGELSAPCLGVALDCYDDRGRPLRGQVGELVLRKPLPSMPLRFWNDPEGSRYRAAYFDRFPGVWRHGDWITTTDHGSIIIHGRSDATLNRHGIRMGSADITAPVERLPYVGEALVIGLEEPDGGYWMPLFVTLTDGRRLDQRLREQIRDTIRRHASPRHVPDDIIVAPAIPHTRTGKKLEVPIKRILRGERLETLIDPTSVDNADVLAWYAMIGAQRHVSANDRHIH
ncbi:acetoacetate--CoA ligase [Actinoallomurus liliacearum]|uniref:Acetoacetate--CoA ligase n=1 Tax=Actinoallomurus liliacearum TaxID=1080073 RepID=A0ABP8TBV7_9ACTN